MQARRTQHGTCSTAKINQQRWKKVAVVGGEMLTAVVIVSISTSRFLLFLIDMTHAEW